MVVGTLTRMVSPSNPKGLLLFGVLILFTTFNPFLGVILILITGAVAEARENYGTLEACGIPVVKPTLFLGSEPNYHKTVLHLADIERYKKFGGIWGSYVGRQPQVYIADPELIRLVFVKDFVYFGDRQDMDLGTDMVNEIMDFQPGEKWKTLRTCLSPLFTTSKLRQNAEMMAECTAEFMEELRAECGDKGRVKIDCRKRLTAWLIDMFARTVLGLRMDDAKNPDNAFANAFRNMMGENMEFGLLHSLSLSFPFLARFSPTFNDEPSKLIETTFRQIMEQRRKIGNQNAKDFLDVLCELWDRVPSKEFRDLGITETTIIAQAVNFFLGGYETSATTLSHLLLHMAENPVIQDKMHAEITEVMEKKGDGVLDQEVTRDANIPYILACINESLRMAPPLYRPERICTKDWTHKGITIKKGTVTMMASWPANRNPKVYPDPDEFKPERFLPENKKDIDQYAFTSFGFGPRNCIGMRFAYENLKLFACYLVLNFRIAKRPDTEVKYKPGSAIVVGFKPLYLDLVDIKNKK